MLAPIQINIQALIDKREQPGLIAASEQLHECIDRATNKMRVCHIQLNVRPHNANHCAFVAPSAVIVSLLPELQFLHEPIGSTEMRWRKYIERLQKSGAPIFVLNIFRHLRERNADGTPTPMLERIRQLNRMAVALSHGMGVAIIDIDRAFAHIGARDLQSDFSLSGPIAAEMLAHTTTLCLLSFGLDGVIDPELQEKAKTFHGSLENVRDVVNRRLAKSDGNLKRAKKVHRP